MADEPTVLFRVCDRRADRRGARGLRDADPADPFRRQDPLRRRPVHRPTILWTFPSGAPIEQEPLVADKEIYVINTAGDLCQPRPDDRRSRDGRSPPRADGWSRSAPTKIYLRSYNLDLFIVDRATGRMVVDPSETHLRAGLNLREYDLNIVNRFNDRLYFATTFGDDPRLREIGQVAAQAAARSRSSRPSATSRRRGSS